MVLIHVVPDFGIEFTSTRRGGLFLKKLETASRFEEFSLVASSRTLLQAQSSVAYRLRMLTCATRLVKPS